MRAVDAAALYGAHGLRPFALRKNDKRPQAPGWQTAELADTLAVLTSTSDANIGIALDSGVVVLDIDRKAADGFVSLQAAGIVLPETLSASTPSGGQHHWFKLPPGVSVPNRVAVAPGLDIRSAGGYVVTAPSTIDGRAYSWDNWDTISPPQIAEIPPELLALIQKRPAPKATTAEQDDPIPEGQRNAALTSIAGSLRRAGLNADEIVDALQRVNERRCAPPLDDAEVATIAASVARYPTPPAPLEAWQVGFGVAPLPPGALAARITEKPRFQLLTADDLAARPPMHWLIRGVLPESGLAAIYGPPGCGKSFLTLDLMGAISTGREWFGHPIATAPCVYVALEGEAGVSQRVQAYVNMYGDPDRLRVILTSLDIRLPDDRRGLVAAIKSAGLSGGVLTLDTLNRAGPGADENDSRAMGELIGAMKALQAELGGLILAVHHSGKDAAKGLRGHSSLLAALDAVVEVSREGEGRTWRLAKAKDGEDGKAHPFNLKVVPVSSKPDEDGVLASSCLVMPEERAADSVRRAKIPAGGNQRIVWDALNDLFRLAPAPDTPPGGLPPGRACIRFIEAVEKTRGKLPVESDRQSERAKQAIAGLINRQLISLNDGYLWPV